MRRLIIFFATLNTFVNASWENVTVVNVTDNILDFHGVQSTVPNLDSLSTIVQERKWISQLFVEVANIFHMDPSVNILCKNDFERYKIHLQNQSVWAIRMLESSEWPAIGIFAGITHHFGNYDECLKIMASGIQGQYCLAEAIYDYELNSTLVRRSEWTEFPDPEISVWSAIKLFDQNPVRVSRRHLKWALCIPSTCSANDLQTSLNQILYPEFHKNGLNVTVNVNPDLCQVQKPKTLTSEFYFSCAVWLMVIVIVLKATINDIFQEDEFNLLKEESKLSKKIFKCFSIVENYKKLTYYSENKTYPGVYFIKLLLIMVIIIEHRGMLFMGFATFNTEDMEMQYNGLIMVFSVLCLGVVDIFLMIGGFQTYFYKIEIMTNGGIRYLWQFILFRWIRLIPITIPLLLLLIYMLPHLSDGPYWDYRIAIEATHCKDNWWTNILVVNNIVKPEEMCFPLSWYIAVDFQLSIIAGILLLIISKNKTIGIFATIVVYVAFIFYTFSVVYEDKLFGLSRPFIKYLGQYRNVEVFSRLYVATYYGAGPYLVGFIAAIIAKTLKEKNYYFPPVRTKITLFLSFVIGMAFQLYGIVFFKTGRPYDVLENAIYGALHRSFFTLPFAYLVCIYFTSGLAEWDKLFVRKGYVPFGNLIWCVFLVHAGPIMYHTFSSRTNFSMTYGIMNWIWLLFTDIVFSFFLAFVLYMLLDGPINNMAKLLQEKINGSEKRSLCRTDIIGVSQMKNISDK